MGKENEKKETVEEDKKEAEKEEEKPKDPNDVLFDELSIILGRFAKGVDSDFIELSRGVRQLNRFRGRLNNRVLSRLASTYVAERYRQRMFSYAGTIYMDEIPLEEPKGPSMDVDEKDTEESKPQFLPESFAFLQLIVSLDLLDKGKTAECIKSLHQLIDYTRELNRRTMDLFSAKAYFYYSLAFHKIGKLKVIRNYQLAWYRTACLQHNEPAMAALINLLLQNYISENLYTQADKFSRRTKFPSSAAPSEMARNFYYNGRIKLVQLQYSDALTNFEQAFQKAPNRGAVGFIQAAYKSLILTKLLMGEIPERTIFSGDRKGVAAALVPYQQLTKAVRNGDLGLFSKAMKTHEVAFKRDKNLTLIERLRHNVIKTGLRKLNMAYSRISMQDVCDRLRGAGGESDSLLTSAKDVEYIVAKAIRDGVIDAVVERGSKQEAILRSKENPDIYNTHEPYHELNRRVGFCLNVHDEAVKAMRYPEEEDPVEEEKKKDADKEDEEKAEVDAKE